MDIEGASGLDAGLAGSFLPMEELDMNEGRTVELPSCE
jgi:hypothetical protein